ncbi:putrescine-ornithine antiporter [Pseudomonas sp. FW306-02-F02-AA]|uniref:Cytochrome B n=1 Tax=Pseudomonas fluorescens TaxID=294 RepID=A0A0N9VS79_PSEFL|nr:MULTISPECIES: cytochrome b [Pseudomonas]ALI01006.1 cytochrome B [Pseudomonas fluorescens]PMZ02554.1 putrescine-ornithine antiporter [Pseudomonas sp. FW306-02-F02-AB]PMZ09969.1 putrescine-ornithine antiporter [Pseudomonas sp. FW306-02-H06C]PMZ16724.1 putrescine-ornithine antiporter [Pseudomonas sp. FW306-02-F02-AA]PMZ23653.1 putrescine-ornithine antiporter [Pseudomonas sp. FW306-02-F08-AA]
MQLRNSSSRYGGVSIFLHWGVALAVFGLFALGLWMVGLDYYSNWRKEAPDLHKSIGLTLFAFLSLRVLWRFISPPPPTLQSYSRMTRLGAKLGHSFLYLSLFAVMIAGYLISTADGVGIPVFGLFEIPALISGLPDQADTAGAIHLYLAWTLVIFSGLHALAALKHHFIDRDATLTRMLGRKA